MGTQNIAEFDGRTWQYDACGIYEELVRVHPDQCEPSEPASWQNPAKIAQYVEMYRAGSDFPPISVCGATPDHPLYKVSDGHHRWRAARRVGATICAWTCFYHPLIGAHGETFWSLARMSATEEGRALATYLGLSWCPRCGHFLNYEKGLEMCRSCQIAKEVLTKNSRPQAHPFEGWDKGAAGASPLSLLCKQNVCATLEIWHKNTGAKQPRSP